MNKFHNILVPTDFYEGFDLALEYALAIASEDAVIHVIHSIEPSLYPADMGFSQISYIDIEKELKESATQELATIGENLKERGVRYRTAILFGRASDQIIAYARDNFIDLICISATGRSGFDRFIFGSTTEKVLRRAECPVLSIKIPEKK